MIQRIQTVYLLLVVGLLIASMFTSLGTFVYADATAYKFTPLGLELKNEFYSTWGIFSLLLLSTIVATASIFLYKNRVLQIRMTIFNSLLLVGYYCTFLVFYFMLKEEIDAFFRISWTLSFPLIGIILNYLAIRAIGKDEVLVKAADRLR